MSRLPIPRILPTSRSRALAVGVTLVAVAAVGCAQSDAMSHERTLAAAGFQMKLADTEEQQEQMVGLPQRKLTPVDHPDGVRFVYADDKYCKCIYVGDQRAYDRYQRMERRERLLEGAETAEMDWGPWGGWYPFWP